MRKFDYGFLKTTKLSPELLRLSSYIHQIRNEEVTKKILNPLLFEKLSFIAKVQSVKNSNAIEGIVTTDKRIAELMNESTEPLNHDEFEIAGYRDALNLIHESHDNISFSEENILKIHDLLLEQAAYEYRGQYKKEDNAIIEIDMQGNRRIRFKPTSKEDTPNAMKQLILAYLEAKQDSQINQLLLIPCVILDFLCIHPFSDCNGRISRLLSLLLMYKNDYDVGKYVSFEQQINKRKDLYYEALKRSSIEWGEGNNDYSFFINNFLYTLYNCYLELEKRLSTVSIRKIKKEERIRKVLQSTVLPMSKKDILDIVPDISQTTVERVLGSLLEKGIVTKIGSFKNAKYIKKRD